MRFPKWYSYLLCAFILAFFEVCKATFCFAQPTRKGEADFTSG